MHGCIARTFHNRKNATFCTNVPMETGIMRLILLGSKKEITSNTLLISIFIQNRLDFFFFLSFCLNHLLKVVEVSGKRTWVGGQRRRIHIQALLLIGPMIWTNCLINRINMRIGWDNAYYCTSYTIVFLRVSDPLSLLLTSRDAGFKVTCSVITTASVKADGRIG